MTREDAFEIWLPIIKMGVKSMPECNEAIDMAIKALKQEPCKDAISRELALEKMADYVASGYADSAEDFEEYSKIICQLPPVNPAEKVGHWEWVQYDSNPNIGNWHCSECRMIIPHMPENTDNTPIYKWCPYCGAKMEGDAE